MTGATIGGLLVAYVAGSFPSAYLAGRWLKGVDLRTVGSGNLGATNVYRELGAVPAVAVLGVDMLKGAAPALLIPYFGESRGVAAGEWWPLLFGAAAIVGHARPVFLMGKGGGKGVATAAGVFLAITPLATGLALAVFAVVVGATRWVSLASLIAAASLPLLQWVTSGGRAPIVASAMVGAFVVWAHRANIARLRAGTEPRIGRPGKVAP